MSKNQAENEQVAAAVECASVTNNGKVRQKNEDSHITDSSLGLFVVSDGMGGHAEGAAASQLVVSQIPEITKEKLSKLRSESTRSLRRLTGNSIKEINRRVLAEAKTENGHKGMGATVVIALLRNGRLFIGNVGDSRAYLFRNKRLRQLTVDHTVVAELLEGGDIKPHETENHPEQHLITQCVGYDVSIKPSVRSLAVKKDDRVLLCSDGLTAVVTDKQIRTVLKQQADIKAACGELVKLANEAGGPDNITVVIFKVL